MKILIVTWYFPPVNAIGAVRLGKFARYLAEHGHDIGVVAGSRWGMPETLPLEFPLQRVAYADWRDINAPPRWAARTVRQILGRGGSAPASAAAPDAAPSGEGGGALRGLSELYVNFLNVPDGRIGWYPDLVRKGMELCRDWRPDIVFGSAPYFTAFLGCRTLSRRLGVPWVGELRDRWADDNYADWPRWHAAIESRLERHVLGSASGIVTVTEPWRDFYAAKYGKPTELAYNGYDPIDFPFDPHAEAENDGSVVNIVYAGRIYAGRRDPTALFEALRLLGPEAEKFRVHFYGTAPEDVWPLADRMGVRSSVRAYPPVPYRESIKVQWNADVLLLLQWNSPREEGVCPGKLFEYLASLRPILGIGYEQGVPAAFIRERNAGVFANDPRVIADHLRRWAAEKAAHGVVHRLPVAVREGLTRDLQFARIEKFLSQFVR
jgi:glycosyltransferase involved in cell wall biosynthesis